MCLCKVGVVNCSLLDFSMEVAIFSVIWGEAIFTCGFPYTLHHSYLVLAKHFEIPLLQRLLDLKCIIPHFCKQQKYKVLLWQKEHFEILDLLKIAVCPTNKSVLAMKSVGQISVCIIITAG